MRFAGYVQSVRHIVPGCFAVVINGYEMINDHPWCGVDGSKPETERSEEDRVTITSESQLRRWLNSLLHMDPRVVFLESPSGSLTSIALASDLSSITYYRDKRVTHSLTALADKKYTDLPRYFVAERDLNTVLPQFLMPSEIVIDVACELFRTGELASSLNWGN